MSDTVAERMQEMMKPIELQLMLCQGRDDELMLACAMLTTARDLLIKNCGSAGMATVMLDTIARGKDV